MVATTLNNILKLITSELTPDSGDISRQKGCRVGYLTQDPDLDPTCTVMEEALRGLTALRALEEELHEAEQALAQVQGTELVWYKPGTEPARGLAAPCADC